MQETYQSRVMHYANVIQVYSPDGADLKTLLDDKIKHYALEENFERRDFWTEVRGAFLNKSYYAENEILAKYEIKYRNYESLFALFEGSHTTTDIITWVQHLPIIEKYVNILASYRFSIDGTYLDDQEESEILTRDSLRFYFERRKSCKTDEEKFVYIPLLMWTLENLFLYHKFSPRLTNFVVKEVIPLFKRHRQAVVEFHDLVSEEQFHRDDDDSLAQSSTFIDKSELYPTDFPEVAAGYADVFTTSLENVLVGGSSEAVYIELAKTVRRVNPLYSIYTQYSLAEDLGLLDSWVYVAPRNTMITISKLIDANMLTFSERNFKFILISKLKSVLDLPVGSLGRTWGKWDYVKDLVLTQMTKLTESGCISTKTVYDVKEYIVKGEVTFQHSVGASADDADEEYYEEGDEV